MTLSLYLPVLLGVLLGLRCNIGILLIVLVPALIVIAGVEAGLGHTFRSVVLAVVFSAFAIQAGYLAGLGARGLFRVLGSRIAPEAKAVH
jgi:hypothetical protein